MVTRIIRITTMIICVATIPGCDTWERERYITKRHDCLKETRQVVGKQTNINGMDDWHTHYINCNRR